MVTAVVYFAASRALEGKRVLSKAVPPEVASGESYEGGVVGGVTSGVGEEVLIGLLIWMRPVPGEASGVGGP